MPWDFFLRYRAEKAQRLTVAINRFGDNHLTIDGSANASKGTIIDFDPEWSKWKGCETRYATQPLSQIRNSEKGSCYLVASGPSINEFDFNLLSDHTLFGVNGSVKLLHDYPIRLSHYMVIDPSFAYDCFGLMAEAIESGAKCYFSRVVLTLILSRRPDLIKNGNVHLVEHAAYLQNIDGEAEFMLGENRTGFSKNIEKGIFSGATVAYAATQVCYYLGFKSVNILGVDLYAVPGKYRFYDGDAEAVMARINAINLEKSIRDDILPAFRSLGKLLDDTQETFEVFNLSAKSRVPSKFVPKRTLKAALSAELEQTRERRSGS